jgi:hypothetical protein
MFSVSGSFQSSQRRKHSFTPKNLALLTFIKFNMKKIGQKLWPYLITATTRTVEEVDTFQEFEDERNFTVGNEGSKLIDDFVNVKLEEKLLYGDYEQFFGEDELVEVPDNSTFMDEETC